MRQSLRAFTIGMALTTTLTVGTGAALADAPTAAPQPKSVSVGLGTGSAVTDILAGGVALAGLLAACLLRSASGESQCNLSDA
ncbi:MAG: hypothetical protein JWN03_7780 [Nocardia sp.]|uniref:hypothetical protein n=1 Tax=Nocardia sp. TaxID=1821 RepID=UPI00262AABCA|nr:hypothetical protein [Nocardia sp.]MCU1647505.1 hypothetical protein [Nocardia sp.]